MFGQKPPSPPGAQTCLIFPKLLTFQVIHQNKSCLFIYTRGVQVLFKTEFLLIVQ